MRALRKGCDANGLAVDTVEQRANGQFFVVQINRRDGDAVTAPAPATKLYGGDGMVIIGRSGSAARALFEAEAQAGEG